MRVKTSGGQSHVFCEKPLALDADGLNRVEEAAQAGEALLTAGFNRRFSPLLAKAKAALQPRTGPLVMLYRVNAGTIPAESWIQRAEGGGRIIGEVCHFVDALTYLCGGVPVAVSAVTARDHRDAVSILISFSEGSTGTIVYSCLGDPSVPKEYIEAFAAGRVIQLNDIRHLSVTKGGKTAITKQAQDKGQRQLAGAFLAAIQGKAELPIPLTELIAVTECTFAIEEALQLGTAVALTGAI